MTEPIPQPEPATALIVVAHHRADSLTAAVAAAAAVRLEAAGYRVDTLNLAEEDFDPRNRVADEPDYDDVDKVYSATVRRHFERIHAARLVIPVFPVWWFGLPAQLKGWFDRVWNHGLTYGRRPSIMSGKRMLWVALAGIDADDSNADLVHALLDNTLRRGISLYCGVPDAHTVALFDSEGHKPADGDRDRHYRRLFALVDEAVDKLLAAA